MPTIARGRSSSSTPVLVPPSGELRRMWRDEFARSAKRGDDLSEVLLLKGLPVEVKEVSGETRALDFVISSEAEDRDRDHVYQDGLDFANYIRNPVVLWAHDYYEPAIGHSLRVWREGPYTLSRDTFAETPFADSIYQLLIGKHLRACSIGGRPSEWMYDEKRQGLDIKLLEVWEHSVCNIPAHPDALARAKAAGIDVAPVEDWCLTLLASARGEGLWIERAAAEVILKSLGNGRGLELFQLSTPSLAKELGQEAPAGDAPPPAADPATPVEPAAEAAPEAPAADPAAPPALTGDQAQDPEPPIAASIDTAALAALVRQVVREELTLAATPPVRIDAPPVDVTPQISWSSVLPNADELAAATRAAFKTAFNERVTARFGVLPD